MLEPNVKNRLSIISFYLPGIHYNLVVRLLNDRFGIQTRGGCSCAGTYGHILLNVDQNTSNKITEQIDAGDLAEKPGWVRASFHPTTTNEEAAYVVDSINALSENIEQWSKGYRFDPATGDFINKDLLIKYPSLNSFDPLDIEKSAIQNDRISANRSWLAKLLGH
jgi:hypothetical protein